jgi:rhodanese-related sulfurtransferase
MQRLLSLSLVAAVALALSSALAFAGEDTKSEKVPDISIKDLKKAIADKKVTVIDVNGSESYKDGHIPSAIDFAAKKDKLKELLPKEKDALVVAYCGGPGCNAYKTAAKAVTGMGYTNVKHLSAGIKGWKDAGEKVEKPEETASAR